MRYRDYFDGKDKPSNEYLLKNGVREGTAKHYHADSGALMGESEYKNGVRDGRCRRYYFDEGGVLMQEAFLRRTNERVWKHDTTRAVRWRRK